METESGIRARRFDAGGATLAEVGEAELLRRLRDLARGVAGTAELVLESGDDAAVWRPPSGRDVAVSVDALVEGEDFRREWLTPEELGRRALEVALSDLAGTGATPMLCLATLCAPAATQVDDVLAIQAGICAAAAAAGCRVAGGDVSAIAGPLVLDVIVIGTTEPGSALRRDAGIPGDALAVTGHLGRAAAGLQVLFGSIDPPSPLAHLWRSAQLAPRARLAEGRTLSEFGVRCAGDISDGLIVDLGRILEASSCGAEVWLDQIPADPELTEILGERWGETVLGGGEDFELIAAVPSGQLSTLQDRWPEGLAPLRVIGRLEAEPGLRLRRTRGGEEVAIPRVLSRHYAR